MLVRRYVEVRTAPPQQRARSSVSRAGVAFRAGKATIMTYPPHTGPRKTIVDLMQVPPADYNLEWLKNSLQAAVQLEMATIPPYLCAMWSIKDPADPVRAMIRDIVLEEMSHMGTACNMRTAAGGTPRVNTADVVPTYPGPLPGGVHPISPSRSAGSPRTLSSQPSWISNFRRAGPWRSLGEWRSPPSAPSTTRSCRRSSRSTLPRSPVNANSTPNSADRPT